MKPRNKTDPSGREIEHLRQILCKYADRDLIDKFGLLQYNRGYEVCKSLIKNNQFLDTPF